MGHKVIRTYYQPDRGFSAAGACSVELSLDRKLLVVLRSSVTIKLPLNSAVHHAHERLLPDKPFERRLRHRERIRLHKQSDRQLEKHTPLSLQSVQSSRSCGAGQNSNFGQR